MAEFWANLKIDYFRLHFGWFPLLKSRNKNPMALSANFWEKNLIFLFLGIETARFRSPCHKMIFAFWGTPYIGHIFQECLRGKKSVSGLISRVQNPIFCNKNWPFLGAKNGPRTESTFCRQHYQSMVVMTTVWSQYHSQARFFKIDDLNDGGNFEYWWSL